jgi:hypothetical protein
VGAAWKENRQYGFGQFEDLLATVYKEYSYSTKRFAEFQEAAAELKMFPYQLSHLQKTRWLAADGRALGRLLKSWRILILDRETVIREAELERDSIYSTLTNRHFLLYAHWLQDVLDQLTSLSHFFQRKQGVIIGMDEILGKYINDILKQYGNANFAGTYTSIFLGETICKTSRFNADMSSCNTIESYNNAYEVSWKNTTITKNGPFAFEIENLRMEMIEQLRIKLINYFPRLSDERIGFGTPSTDFQLKHFNFLQTKALPVGEVNAADYKRKSENHVASIARHFKLDVREAISEWRVLVDDMVSSSNYHIQRNPQNHPVDFWAFVFNEIPNIGSTIKYLIKTTLVLPATSSDAERFRLFILVVLLSRY